MTFLWLLGSGIGPGLAQTAASGAAAGGRPLFFGEVRLAIAPIYSPAEVAGASAPLRLVRRLMNGLHTQTRPGVIRRELLFAAGDPFEPELLAETERNLRTLGFLHEVRVAAVDTTEDGRVSVLISARESWSLETSFTYSRASGGEQRWNVKLSDNNFLGRGVTLGAGVGADENTTFWNLWYRQRRLLGSDLWFGVDYSELDDGHLRGVFLSRPFWAQDDAWGMSAEAWDRTYERRFYLSNAGPAGIDPERATSLYAYLPYRFEGVDLCWQRRIAGQSRGRIWRLGGGWRWTLTRFSFAPPWFELSDGRWADLAWLQEADEPAAREQGRTGQVYLWLHTEGRRWTKRRFVLQYGHDEDVCLDSIVDLRIGPELPALGTTTAGGVARLRAEGWWQRWTRVGSGLLLMRAEGEVEQGAAGSENHRYSLVTGWVAGNGDVRAPWLTRVFAEWGHGQGLLGSEALVLGLDRGLRTLEFDGMAGDRLLRWNLEQGKVVPGEVLGLMRAGGAVFYNGGAAWWRDEGATAPRLRHELGFGLRFGPTRSANSQSGRIDLTWDLAGGGPVVTATTRGLF